MGTKTLPLIAAALAITTVSAKAEDAEKVLGLTDEQFDVVQTTIYAYYAGTGGRCPRFHLIKPAIFDEIHSAGIDDTHTDGFKAIAKVAFEVALTEYEKSPSEYCLSAWKMYGPDGPYKPQMLEAN